MRMIRRLTRIAVLAAVTFYGVVALSLVYLRYLPPVTTGVQIQRRVEALTTGSDYTKRYRFVPRDEIAGSLARAVIAAEDTRFYEHRGFDWVEIRSALESARSDGAAARGASTITQQLVKNLYFTTHRSYVRKVLEALITPAAELLLGKDRILELYLNVIEWGPGVYGAEAAARYHYGVSATDLSLDHAVRLAAIIPAPRIRRPDRMDRYAGTIRSRMRAMGW